MITATRVSKMYASFRAVDDVSFTIRAGECVGLLGPNGAGKTTTIRMLTGFLPPSVGNVHIAGFDVLSESMQARRVTGYLPESTPNYPEMRVREYLTFRGRLYGLSGKTLKTALERVIGLCWLGEVPGKRVGHLSKGYRQRVGLAAALIHDPKVLILDEPTNGLDPSQIRETRSLIRTLADDRTVLVSSHILPEIEQTCDRVLIMARGRLRADGAPAELVERFGNAAGGKVVVEFEDVTGGVEVIRSAAGVGRVDDRGVVDGRWRRAELMPVTPGEDVRERVARAMAQAGITCREIARPKGTLEQVFLRVLEEAQAGESAGAGGAPAGTGAGSAAA